MNNEKREVVFQRARKTIRQGGQVALWKGWKKDHWEYLKKVVKWRSGMKELTKKIDGKSRKNGKGVKFCQIWFKVGKQMKGLFLCLLVCLFFDLRGVLFLLFIVCSFASFNEAA